MGKILGRYSRFLFKLFILMQLYCYHNLEVNAAPPHNFKTCDAHLHHNGTYFEEEPQKNLERIKRPVRLLPTNQKEKNHTRASQEKFYGPASSCTEISKLGYTLNGYYLVKGKIQTKNDQVEVLDCLFKHPNGSREVEEEKIGLIDIEIYKSTKSVKRRSQEPFAKISLEDIKNVDDERSKRPVRLLPMRIILGKPKNNTDEHESETRFYGPASSCEELGKLGYTLNGLYLVDCADKSQRGKIEIIECRFKQPQGSNKEAVEERIGFVNIEAKKAKSVQRRQLNVLKRIKLAEGSYRIKRPIRLLPPHILYGNEKDKTEEKNFVSRFYGPPTTCIELGKLGYTLNGYYLVKDDGAASMHIEIALCRFHQRIVVNETLKEERFSMVKATTTITPTTTAMKSVTTTKTTSPKPLNSLFEERFGNCSSSPATAIQQLNCDEYPYPIVKNSWKYNGPKLCYVTSQQEMDYPKAIYKCLKSSTWFGTQKQNYYIIIRFTRPLVNPLRYEGGFPISYRDFTFYCLAIIRDSAGSCEVMPQQKT